MSKNYIGRHFTDIKKYACAIEQRLDDSWCTRESLLRDNAHYYEMCKKYGYNYILIDEDYCIDIDKVCRD